jgi:hypothetical protein
MPQHNHSTSLYTHHLHHCFMEMVPLPEVEETLNAWKKKKQKKKKEEDEKEEPEAKK